MNDPGADCIFCRVAAGAIPARVIVSDDEMVAFHDIDPKAPVHALLIPRKHIPTLNDLGPEDAGLLGRMMDRIPALARELGIADRGYRVVANCLAPAGQSVFHIHFHLLGGRNFTWPPG